MVDVKSKPISGAKTDDGEATYCVQSNLIGVRGGWPTEKMVAMKGDVILQRGKGRRMVDE